jgi:multidrug efflux pump subunit AcrB
MTSFAFILGVLPLVLATGAGKNGRQSVGTTVFGGMLAATTLNLLFIPLLYIALRTLQEGRGAGRGPKIVEQTGEEERIAV